MGRLFEREGELAQLRRLVGDVRSGDGRVVVVEGPPGIGKTALLGSASEIAAAEGALVLAARVPPLEAETPYGLARRLFASVVERDQRLVPPRLSAETAQVLGRTRDSQQSRAAPEFSDLELLHTVCRQIAASRPLLLAIDDAHWADEPSLRFLVFLASRLSGAPVLMLLAVRPGDPGATRTLLAELMLGPATTLIRPAPLSAAGAREALGDLVGGAAIDREFSDACHAATAGNPFLLEELGRELSEPEAERTVAAVRQLGPKTISRAVLFRLADAGPQPVQAARALAVLGGDAGFADVAAVAGLTSDELSAAVVGLIQADVVASDAGRLRFIHPIVEAAVYADLDPAERARAHAAAAEVLRAKGEPPERLAPHLLHAPPAGRRDAIAALLTAGRRAIAEGAPAAGARYLRRALEEDAATVDATLLGALGIAEARAGEAGAVAHLQAAVQATSDPDARARLSLSLGRALTAAGEPGAAAALLDAGRSTARDPELLRRLSAEWLAIAMLDPGTAAVAGRELDRGELPPLEGNATLLMLKTLAQRHAAGGPTAREAADLAERALANGKLLERESVECPPLHFAVWVLLAADRYHLADSVLDQALADARAQGSAWGLNLVRSLRAVSALRQGRLRDAEVEARRAVEAARLFQATGVYPDPLPFLAQALVEQGKVDEAAEEIEQAEAAAPVLLEPRFRAFIGVRGRVRAAQGRLREALEDQLTDGWLSEQAAAMSIDLGWRSRAVPILHELGRADEARALAREELTRCRHWGAPRAHGMALRTAGLVEADDPRAIDLGREAVAVLERSAARLELARALATLGVTERDGGDVEAGRTTLRRALDVAHRVGARLLEAQVHEELLASGARPQRFALTGAGSLTPSQRRVAELAADGLTNQEIAEALFVSVKTVETHLRHAFRKLGVTSRKQLARLGSDEPHQ